MAALSLVFDIIGKDHASKTLDKVSGSAEKTGGHLKGLGKSAAVAFGGAALGGITAFTAGLVGGFKEAISYQKITDQLAQTIKSTGGAAGVSVDGLKKYAGQLESMSGVDEELILSSQNVLATFTQIQNKTGKGNDIFNQASLAALNLSTTLGTDVNGAAVQVGKALNDPIKGITALGKAGVSFTQAQKDQIKTLVKSGNTLGAQKIILGELNKEFGGAAAAAGKGFGGTIARLKDTVSDAFRDIATRALPTLTKLADILAKVLPVAIAFVAGAFSKASAVIKPFFAGLSGKGAAAGFIGLLNDIGLGIRAFILAFKEGDVTSDGLVGKFEIVGDFLHRRLLPVLQTVGGFIRDHLKPILLGLGLAVGLLTAPITTVVVGLGILYAKSQTFRDIIGTVADFITARVVPAFVSIGDFLTTKVFPILVKVGAFLVSTFTPTFKALSAFVTGSVLPAFRGLADRIRENQPMFEKIGKVIGVVAVVIGFLAAKILGFLLPILVKLVGFLLRTLFAAIGLIIGIIARFVAAIGGIIHIVGTVVEFLRPAFKFIVDAWLAVAGAIIHGAAAAFGWVPGIGPKLKAAAKEFDKFKDAVNASLSGIKDKKISLTVETHQVANKLAKTPGLGGSANATRAGFATGGRPPVGVASWIGEQGKELWVPDRPGTILPHNLSMALAGGQSRGGLTIQGDVILQKADEDRDNGQALTRGLRNLAFTMGV